MSGAEHRRASAFIGGFKRLRLFQFSFINHASRTKFDQFNEPGDHQVELVWDTLTKQFQEFLWRQNLQVWETASKVAPFGTGLVHQVQKVAIAGRNKPGIGSCGEVYVNANRPGRTDCG